MALIPKSQDTFISFPQINFGYLREKVRLLRQPNGLDRLASKLIAVHWTRVRFRNRSLLLSGALF
jgi:hypothetical protein